MSIDTSNAENASVISGDIVARAGKYFRNTRYIMSAVMVLLGCWFLYDGFIGWPKENEKHTRPVAQGGDGAEKPLHQDADLRLQKILGFGLPPLGIILFVRMMRNSRGEYRLSGTTLNVPGHPPVGFESITSVDKRLWDRKGIAYVSYDVDGKTGTLKLDDFVYERAPTDQIYDAIERYAASASSAPDSAA